MSKPRREGSGGKRVGAGRKPIDPENPMVSKAVTISMPKANWDMIESYIQMNKLSRSGYFRDFAMNDMLINQELYGSGKKTKKRKV